jgi:hypothetical protein
MFVQVLSCRKKNITAFQPNGEPQKILSQQPFSFTLISASVLKIDAIKSPKYIHLNSNFYSHCCKYTQIPYMKISFYVQNACSAAWFYADDIDGG